MGRTQPLTNTKRSRWILLAITALSVIFLSYFGSRLRVSYRTALTGCARDDGTGGGSGLYRWTRRLGIPVKLRDSPLWEAFDNPQEVDHCVLTMGNGSWSPTGLDLEPEQWRKIRQWLARGNTLIVVTSAPGSLPEDLRRDLVTSSFTQSGAEHESTIIISDSIDNRPETIVDAVKGGASLTVAAKGARWTALPQANSDKPLSASKGAALGQAKTADGSDPTSWQIAGDAAGGVLFRIPVEKGSIYFLLDSFAWTNTGLDRGENAHVLAGILKSELRGGALGLDEYRHGHGRPESFLTYLLHLPGSSAVLWFAMIWGALYLYGRNIRLRPAEPYTERERRTAQEYINAVAQLYERARAAPLVVEAVARRLRQLSRSTAEHPAAVESVLKRAENFIRAEQRPASPTAGIHLVKDLIQLRKEIYGTRSLS